MYRGTEPTVAQESANRRSRISRGIQSSQVVASSKKRLGEKQWCCGWNATLDKGKYPISTLVPTSSRLAHCLMSSGSTYSTVI
jgi:hypothetical protein